VMPANNRTNNRCKRRLAASRIGHIVRRSAARCILHPYGAMARHRIHDKLGFWWQKQKVLAAKPASTVSSRIVGPGLLTCPVRGPLSASALAADNLTPSEEARRIDFIHLLIDRDYPPQNISIETVILQKIGEKGRNNVRADVVVFDRAASLMAGESLEKRLTRATLAGR